MFSSNKILPLGSISLFLLAGILAAKPPQDKEPAGKNLKVIPKNIDPAQIERLMYRMTHDLGVLCSFCHPYTKPGVYPIRVDFVTDELPMKNRAREMMRMTDKINKKYFNFRNDYSLEAMNNRRIVNCNTCHRGIEIPSSKIVIPKGF